MADEKPSKPDTIAVHAGHMSAAHFGVVNTPVYRASTILSPNLAALESRDAPYTYGLRGTPTSRSFEDAISELEGGARTKVVPSGLAAITFAILAVCRAGEHLLMVDSCYGPSRAFCDKMLARLGIETTYYDSGLGSEIAGLFRANTRAVFCESPGSLTFEVQDVPAIAAAAHAHGASVLMDNTWASPLLFQPLAHGVDLSIQAVTKYVGGHADLMMGYVAANESHAKRLLDTHDQLGLYASGDDCFLALRGLRTMPVRLKRHEDTALKLARWLKARPEVARVLHPALEDDPGHALWKRDFKGSSGLFGVVFKPMSKPALAVFFDGLTQFGIGYSWGGYESLIVPAHITRTANSFRAEGPVIRIHAGLENADDLIADLAAGFERVARCT